MFVAARTRIDPESGTAGDHKLFHQEMVANGTTFELRLRIDARAGVNDHDLVGADRDDHGLQTERAVRADRDAGNDANEILQDLLLVLRDLCTEDGQAIGKGQADGFGRVRFAPESIVVTGRSLQSDGSFASFTPTYPRSFVATAVAEPLRFVCKGPFPAAELGAVLFALTHGGDPSKPYRHMIGRAKPFGAGQMRLRSLDLAVESNSNMPVVAPEPDERLNETTGIGFCSSASTASIKPFLAAFAAHMRRQPGLQAFPNVAAILEFLGASDPTAGAADHEKLDYMALEEFNPVRKATKPLKDPRAGRPARGRVPDGRLLPAPWVAKPVFWT